MVESAEIANMIAGGGNYYTIPFYKDIEGDELNYDGATDITSDDTEDGKQSGVVYGRAKGWKNTIFINDFTGADPMANILARIQKWRGKKMQKRIVGILIIAFTIFMVIGRLICGVHWITDIIGGLIISLCLVNLYYQFIKKYVYLA